MNDETSPSRRPRPSYGLPGPTGPEHRGDQTPGWSGPGGSSASGSSAVGGSSAPRPVSSADHPQLRSGGAPSPSPWGQGTPGAGGGNGDGGPWSTEPWPGGPAVAARPRGGRRMLIAGIVLLVLGVLAGVIGLVLALSRTAAPLSDGLTPFEGSSTTLELSAGKMSYVYVPVADAASTTCTADPAEANTIEVVPLSGTAPVGPAGEDYEQTLGIVARQSATVTVTCEGTDGAGTIGPFSMWGIVLPLLLGVGAGLLLGLVGLVLTIIGIIRLVRAGRAR